MNNEIISNEKANELINEKLEEFSKKENLLAGLFENGFEELFPNVQLPSFINKFLGILTSKKQILSSTECIKRILEFASNNEIDMTDPIAMKQISELENKIFNYASKFSLTKPNYFKEISELILETHSEFFENIDKFKKYFPNLPFHFSLPYIESNEKAKKLEENLKFLREIEKFFDQDSIYWKSRISTEHKIGNNISHLLKRFAFILT